MTAFPPFSIHQRAVTDALEHGHRHVVPDLHQLRSLDPDGMGLLWAALRAVLRRGGTLATAGFRPSLHFRVDPLVPHGLTMYGTVRAATSAHSGEVRT
jgi:hypothetical protein